MDLKLKDKVVVITAGTGGCGKALVKAFADEGIDIEITADGSRPTEQFTPDTEPFIQGM